MSTTAQIAAADQYQAVINADLDQYVAAVRADLATGIDPAAALVSTTTQLRIGPGGSPDAGEAANS